jgi:hypothetical protein
MEGDLRSAGTAFADRFAPVAVKLPSADDPPAQTLIVFNWQTAGPMSYVSSGRSFHGVDAEMYAAATPGQRMAWESDLHQSKFGYFLIGSERQSNLWRVYRVETDYINRFVFSIVPVTLVNGTPSLRLERLDDPEIRTEVGNHWKDLQTALDHHRYRSLITAAKNIAEGLLYFGIRDRLEGKRADIGSMLPLLRDLLPAKRSAKLPFTELDYHLMSKLRILHQRTHVEKGIAQPLRPELALTVVQDLVEILRSIGLAD